ncbi:MAG: alpha/beta fold hydrolase [Planctomycetaceae bacterium]
MRRIKLRLAVLLVGTAMNCLGTSNCLQADDVVADTQLESDADAQPSQPEFNITMKTLGGRQLWGDVHFFHGWRIQQNVLDGHFRLLDEDDVRHAWGSHEACHECLQQIRRDQGLKPMSGKAVILVHGIIRSSKSFDPMKEQLRSSGYQVFGFDYPSTRVDIPTSADYLKRCMASLEGIDEINFVVHSMGGLVVRASLEEGHDPRIRRMVMLGVPNRGARMANLLQKNFFYRTLYGPAGQQLIEDAEGYIARLPTPAFDFALISGARGTENGYNPLVPGDDDGTVSLESTRLPGACDFMTVPILHSVLMWDEAVISSTDRFLRTGALRESGMTEPVPVSDKTTDVTASSFSQTVTP